MKITTICSFALILIFWSLTPAYASDRDNIITPMLSILLTGPKLPPGTTFYPATGIIIIRYDRISSNDWIEIVGTDKSGKPAFPITRVQGNVNGNSCTVIWVDEKLTKFIYPKWTIDITYDSNGKPNWTYIKTVTVSSKATCSLEAPDTVDCSKSREFYEAALNEAEALWTAFYHHWEQWQISISGPSGGTYPDGAQLMTITKSLGIIYDLFSHDPAQLMPFIENKIEATEMLASYDIECNAEPCADRGLPGPEIVTWKGHEWQRCDDGKQYHWEEAKTFCADLYLGGYTDWHLPTKEELKSLVVCTNGTATPLADYPGHPNSCPDGNNTSYERPTINAQFSCQTGSYYWSSNVYDEDEAWIVFFYYGNSGGHLRENSSFVRCVRTTILN